LANQNADFQSPISLDLILKSEIHLLVAGDREGEKYSAINPEEFKFLDQDEGIVTGTG
jgi:hypothetical protein